MGSLRISGPLADPRRRIPADFRRSFLLDATAATLVGVFLATTSAFAPVVARRLGADTFLISLVTAAQFAGNLFAFLSAHYLQDKPKMPYLVWAWTISRGLFLFTLFITTPLPFVLLIVLFWIIASLPVPGYTEVIRAIYPDAYRGRAMGYVRVAMTAAVTVATPVAGILLDLWGYQVIFPLAALFGIASGQLFGKIRYEDTISAVRRPLSHIWRVLSDDRYFAGFSMAFLVYGFGNLMIVPLLPIFLVDELRLSYGEVGLLGLVNSIFWMLGYLVWGRTIDRRGPSWTLSVNFALTAGVPLAFFFARDPWLVAVAYVFNGITTAGIDIGWLSAVIAMAPREKMGAYTALHSFFLGLRGLTAPFLGAALMLVPGVGLRGALLAGAALNVIGWLMFRRLAHPKSAVR